MKRELTPGYYPDNTPPDEGWEQYNTQWWLSQDGDMCAMGCYVITADRLGEPQWLLHLCEKSWFDANKFIPAWFEACRRAGIADVNIWTCYN